MNPYKYEKLKERLQQKVVVSDGRLVWEGQNAIECVAYKLANPLSAAIVATRIDEFYHRGEHLCGNPSALTGISSMRLNGVIEQEKRTTSNKQRCAPLTLIKIERKMI